MELEKAYFKTTRTSRHYCHGDLTSAEVLWVVFHGYGQQAKFFAQHLSPLVANNSAMLIPEALNRFYLAEFSGRVGASWMTSDDREVDINDNINYLEALLASILKEHPNIKKINVFGFSQGISTAIRWLAQSQYTVQKVIAWAGSLPPDLNWNMAGPVFRAIDWKFVVGTSDEFINAKSIQQNESFFIDNKIDYQLITFDGKHELNAEVLKDIAGD